MTKIEHKNLCDLCGILNLLLIYYPQYNMWEIFNKKDGSVIRCLNEESLKKTFENLIDVIEF